jgi:hypothetical protein
MIGALLLCGLASADTGPELYQKAEAAFARGEFKDAATLFENAYELDHVEGVLFNAAQAHRRAFETAHEPSERDRAAELYKAYLVNAEKGPQRLVAEKFVALAEIDAMKSQSMQLNRRVDSLLDHVKELDRQLGTRVPLRRWVWAPVVGGVAIALGLGLGLGLSAHAAPQGGLGNYDVN